MRSRRETPSPSSSTATIARNEEGNPYSPRKQGAGLAGIHAAVNTQGYITVKDKDGNVSDRTKFELGDDPLRTGEYNDIKFTVHNVGSTSATYSLRSYVMTETLASDGRTVAEKAYMLEDSIVLFTMVYAGLLRGAKTLDMTIYDKTTGEVVFEKTENNVGKSYAAGGANRGSSIMLEINPLEWGLSNNTTYTFVIRETAPSPSEDMPSTAAPASLQSKMPSASRRHSTTPSAAVQD